METDLLPKSDLDDHTGHKATAMMPQVAQATAMILKVARATAVIPQFAKSDRNEPATRESDVNVMGATTCKEQS